MHSSRSHHSLAVFLAIMIFAGAVSGTSPVIADAGSADPYIDHLAEAADTPTLNWADCGDGFVCATAVVPLNYNRPNDELIDLAVIKLPATDPNRRMGTLFVNFGGPGQSGVNRLRDRARWPWLFSDDLRSRFDLVSWDPRGVSRSATVNCFSSAADQSRFFAWAPGLPVDAQREQDIFAWSEEFAERCEQRAGHILEHVSSSDTARDLELLRRAVGDTTLTYHGISYGTQLGAIYANLFPGRVRAMVLDGSLDFDGNVNGHGSEGATVPLDARQGVATAMAATSRSSCATVRRPVRAARSPQAIPRPSGPSLRRGLAEHLSPRSTAAGGPTPRSSPTLWLGRRHTRNWLNCSSSYTTRVPRCRSSSTPLPAANRSLKIGATSRIWPTAKTPIPPSSALTAPCQPIPLCTAEQQETRTSQSRISAESPSSARSRAPSGRATTPTATPAPGTGARPRRFWC